MKMELLLFIDKYNIDSCYINIYNTDITNQLFPYISKCVKIITYFGLLQCNVVLTAIDRGTVIMQYRENLFRLRGYCHGENYSMYRKLLSY